MYYSMECIVEDFKYLGSTVQSTGECGRKVKKRVQAGWNGWRRMSGVICDKRVPARVKVKVCKVYSGYITRRMQRMELPGKRKRGRPNKRFLDVVKEDMAAVDGTEEDTEDRNNWRWKIRCGDP